MCLLTDAHGIAAEPGRLVWEGMQVYSHSTSVRVSYVQVVGPDTTANAAAFLNGLVRRRCPVVVAVGASQAAAVDTASAAAPGTQFLVVGATRHDHPNVTALDPATGRLGNAVADSLTRISRTG